MKQLDLNNFKDFGEAEVGRRILVDDPVIRVVLVFRFGLSYPDERHLERFAELCDNVPGTLQELRSRYIDLFEAGMPQSRCPLLESAWLLNRPAGDVVLENKLLDRSEEHTSELQSLRHLVCRLLLEKKKKQKQTQSH